MGTAERDVPPHGTRVWDEAFREDRFLREARFWEAGTVHGNIGTPIECRHTLQYYIHCYPRLPISPRVMMVHDVKTTLIVDVSSLHKQTRTRKLKKLSQIKKR